MTLHIRHSSSPAATSTNAATSSPTLKTAEKVQQPTKEDKESPNNNNNNNNRRRSWFSLSINRPKSKIDPSTDTTAQPGSPAGQAPSAGNDPHRPLQFDAPRFATLYVSPSERNLYLAAMSQLENPPPELPLWSDPTPSLPPLATHSAFEAHVPNPNGRPVSSVVSSNHNHSPHPLTTRPMSPKLVTSPGVRSFSAGLSVRDEFRLNRVPPRSTRHAMLSLVPPATLKFTGFPNSALLAADEALIENWRMGVLNRSEGKERIQQRSEAKEGGLWKVELQGRVWRRKGRQELDSIRLMLAILTALGVHGWMVEDSIQAGSSKKGCHNLIFSYSPEIFTVPPTFFAVSFPLPDRISIISAPSKVTPSILSAVRNAILYSSQGGLYSRKATAASSGTNATSSSASATALPLGKEKRGIKLEGWVHPGVYRFWVGGMRRWVVGGVRKKVIDNLHPSLILGLVNNISSLHMTLVSSVPLLPLTKGRDILIFASLPSSGLSYRDAWKPEIPDHRTSGSSSPVLVSPLASVPATFPDPRSKRQAMMFDSAGNSSDLVGSPAGRNAVEIDSNGRRVLPWTSMLSEAPFQKYQDPSLPRHSRQSSGLNEGSGSGPGPGSIPAPSTHQRTPSVESNQPLITGSARSSPKSRNVLLKKNSSRRKPVKRMSAQSLQSNNSLYHRRGQSDSQAQKPRSAWKVHVPGVTNGDHSGEGTGGKGTSATATPERWSMIDVPANVGHMGVTMYDHRQSMDGTHESGESVYTDAQPHHGVNPAQPIDDAPHQGGTHTHVPVMVPLSTPPGRGEAIHPETGLLQLGQPMVPDLDTTPATEPNLVSPDGYASLPIREGVQNRRGMLVQNSQALTSVHGSMGFAGQSVLSFSPSERNRLNSGPERHSEVSGPTGRRSGSQERQRQISGTGSLGPNHFAEPAGQHSMEQKSSTLAPPAPTPTEANHQPSHGGPGELGRLLREGSPSPRKRTTGLPPSSGGNSTYEVDPKATVPSPPVPAPIPVPTSEDTKGSSSPPTKIDKGKGKEKVTDSPPAPASAPAPTPAPVPAPTPESPPRPSTEKSKLGKTFDRLMGMGKTDKDNASAPPSTVKVDGGGGAIANHQPEEQHEGSNKSLSEHGKTASSYETAPSQSGSAGRSPGAVGSMRTKISLGRKK